MKETDLLDSADFSNNGPIILHGPHHLEKKTGEDKTVNCKYKSIVLGKEIDNDFGIRIQMFFEFLNSINFFYKFRRIKPL